MNDQPGIGPFEQEFICQHRVAHLATADARGRPHVIPVCFGLLDGCLYIPIDAKPKSVEGRQIKRVRNIEVNPEVSFLVDDYDENWDRLAYVLVHGVADLREVDAPEHGSVVTLLRAKYPQYEKLALDACPFIRIHPTRTTTWAWSGWPPTHA